MEWIIPAVVLIIAAILIIRFVVRESRRDGCSGCPLSETCPMKNLSEEDNDSAD